MMAATPLTLEVEHPANLFLQHVGSGIFVAVAVVLSLLVARAYPRANSCLKDESIGKHEIDAGPVSSRKEQATGARSITDSRNIVLIDAYWKHARLQNLEGMAQALERIEKHYRAHVGLKEYRCIINKYAKAGNPETAHSWLKRMMKSGFSDAKCVTSVMHSYVQNGAHERALDLAVEMTCKGMELNVFMYNLIIEVWKRAGSVDKAQWWMKKMIDSGVQPNEVSFGTVMTACAQAGLHEDLDVWFQRSQALGFQLARSVYLSILSSFRRRNDLSYFVKWHKVMFGQGMEPHLGDGIAVVRRLCEQGDMELAGKLIDTMRAARQDISAHHYSQFIGLAMSKGQKQAALLWAEACHADHGRLNLQAIKAMEKAGLRISVPWDVTEDSCPPQDDNVDGGTEATG